MFYIGHHACRALVLFIFHRFLCLAQNRSMSFPDSRQWFPLQPSQVLSIAWSFIRLLFPLSLYHVGKSFVHNPNINERLGY